MVKADVRRDYYADLGLSPAADSEDIKRQFRKLALKYHPDRNPGKELEFNAKFQAIQAAHEILSDPQHRIKYDTDRLRNGYYGPKPTSARKNPTGGYSSTKPSAAKNPFGERPKSFHTGPSTGAQRYASYARAAPKQPWEKMRDETQTRADAYRGFQEMKGMHGWSQFDPRGGRSGQTGSVPRPSSASAGQSARPKSAYEHMRTSAKATGPENPHAQSSRRKQGFAPHAAGGDEPMATKTSSYRSAPRFEREFTPASSPTARKPAAGFQTPTENIGTPEYERKSSKYASTGGEKTFFSSSLLGRSTSVRSSPKSPKSPKQRPRTNPPSPTPLETGRHRSASPNLKGRNRNYDSTSSSDLDDDEEEEGGFHFKPKPKAVPKSRLRKQPFGNSRTQNTWNPAPDSDSATSGSAKYASDTPMFFRNGDAFDFNYAPNSKGQPQNGAFKSSSHDDLRKKFSSNHKDQSEYFTDGVAPNGRGRTSSRNSPHRTGHSVGNSSKHESTRSESASQPQMPFVEATYLDNDWGEAFKFKNMSEALPNADASQRQFHAANSQRNRSPRKPARTTTRVRTAPQPASVATEAEEAAKTTFEARTGQESAGSADIDIEAMDLDDELPGTTAEPVKPVGPQVKRTSTPKTRPTTKSARKDGAALFNLKILSAVPPLTSTNNGGLEDLKDVYATLPFESRAKTPQKTQRDPHPRELICPNPPKRPEPPQPAPITAGAQQHGIPRAQWDRYMAEMATYIREWNTFTRRMQGHFLARQSVIETAMAPNWVGGIGDSARVNGVAGDGEDLDDESDDSIAVGNGKWGFSSYVRWLDEDDKVHKHWDVARERHRECILKHQLMRDWVLSGGRVS